MKLERAVEAVVASGYSRQGSASKVTTGRDDVRGSPESGFGGGEQVKDFVPTIWGYKYVV